MRRLLALTVLPLALAAAMLGSSGAARAATAAPQPDPTCILGIICLPGGSPTPTPTPTSPAPSPSPTSASPSPTASPSVSASPDPSSSSSATHKKNSRKPAAKHASVSAGLVASAAGSVLTAGSATMTGFVYQGNVNMPVAGGGTVTMMKFTADSMILAGGVTDSVTQGGSTAVTSSPTLAFSGGVTLYAARLSGSLLGIPVTFTPSTVSAVLLSAANLITGVVPITLTNVTTDQPVASAGSLRTGPLAIGSAG